MIDVVEGCEYTVSIADLIETMASLTKFVLKIWHHANYLPLKSTHECDYIFLQESLKIISDDENKIVYVPYDEISSILLEFGDGTYDD